jgi:MFS family permease
MRIRSPIPIRYRVLALLFAVSFVNYFIRNPLSVAVPGMRTEFGFTNVEIGWILGSFNLTYALLMIPGGVLCERIGVRRALAAAAIAWGLLTWLTGFAPALLAASATGALVALVAVRLLGGAANAPVFPIVGGTIESWFPPGRWAFANAICSAGDSRSTRWHRSG